MVRKMNMEALRRVHGSGGGTADQGCVRRSL
jgi:hypothetical protein